jgi:hypothetical protein
MHWSWLQREARGKVLRELILHGLLTRMKRRERSCIEESSGVACAGCGQNEWSRPTGTNLQEKRTKQQRTARCLGRCCFFVSTWRIGDASESGIGPCCLAALDLVARGVRPYRGVGVSRQW